MPPRRRTPSRPRVAGVHLDGAVATLVEVTNPDTQPRVLHVTQHTGFTPADALTKALTGLPHEVPARVTFTAPGTRTAPLDVTSSILANRAELDALARRCLPQLDPAAAIAAVLPLTLDEHALTRGLALAAPHDIVTTLQRAADVHPQVELTLTAAAYGPLPGLHLALRRHSCEVVLVRDHRAIRAHTLPTPGSAAIAAQLGDEQRLTGIMTGTHLDVAGSQVLRGWFTQVVADLSATLTEWAYAGEPVATLETLLVHGHMANSGLLDEALAAVGMRREPHPLVGLPHAAPLDAVDAYMAAITAARSADTASFAVFGDALSSTPLATRRKTSATSRPGSASRSTSSQLRRRPRLPQLTKSRAIAASALIILTGAATLAPQAWGTYQARTEANAAKVGVETRPDAPAALAAAHTLAFTHAAAASNAAAAAALEHLAANDPDAQYTAAFTSRLFTDTSRTGAHIQAQLRFSGPDARAAAMTTHLALTRRAATAAGTGIDDLAINDTTVTWIVVAPTSSPANETRS